MTPQELKNSILQLAIQGKLVEQRPEEGTAAELVEKILAAKNAKDAKGNLTRSRGARGAGEWMMGLSHLPKAALTLHGTHSATSASPREEIPDDEKPFDIPESWEWVRLGEIGSWASGTTPSRTQAEYFGGSIPWLKTGDLTDGYVASIPESITELALERTSLRLNPVGSVLMAMYGATIGKLGILQIAATTNQACCACIPYDGVWNKYLFYFLMARRSAFIKMGEGGAQPNISKEKIVNAPIPLPPIAEQKRIVAKIEELLPLIDRYEKAWSKLEDFNKRFPVDMQKSLLQMAIQGKLVEQRAEEGTAAELLEKILAAKNAKGAKKNLTRSRGARGEKETSALSASPREEIPDDEKPFDIPKTWKWVRFGHIMINRDAERIPLSVDERSKLAKKYDYYGASGVIDKVDDFIFDKPLLLIGEDGANLLTRNTPIAFIARGKYWVNNHAHVLDCNSDLVHIEYVMWFINAINLAPYVTGTAQPKMNQQKMNSIPVALPPFAEQKRIVAKLEELLPLCARLK